MRMMNYLWGAVVIASISIGAQAFPGFSGRDLGMDPQQMINKLSVKLDLTEDQREDIDAILNERSSTMESQRDELKSAHHALKEASAAEPFDEAGLRELAERASELQVEAIVQGAKLRAEVRQVLTPAQREKMGEMHGKMQERRQHMKKKHRARPDRYGKRDKSDDATD